MEGGGGGKLILAQNSFSLTLAFVIKKRYVFVPCDLDTCRMHG